MIHCGCHRTELAIQAVFSNGPFHEIDELYKGMYFLHKNSGKILSEVKGVCQALNIYYKLRKIHRTRFVNHRRRGYKRFLDIWPALVTAYKDVVSDPKTRAETRAKI